MQPVDTAASFKCAPLKTEVKYKNHKNYTQILAGFFNVKLPYIW